MLETFIDYRGNPIFSGMFNGLKKMVGKSGSPGEVGQPNSQLVLAELDPLHTPLVKVGKKRKVLESTAGPVSIKKK